MLKILLLPFSFIYGLVLRFRHLLFDTGMLPSKSFDIPTISVGNLSLGGTGKTPHTEYLTRLLKKNYRVAIVSRGYMRKSKGYVLAGKDSTFQDIGDEPMQYQRKFGEQIYVAVDKNRCRAVKKLQEMETPPEAIILDDAMQHRFIKPGLSILLTDYRRLYTDDYLVPAGKLRDLKYRAKKADIIVVTKTDKVLSPIVKRILLDKIKPQPGQNVYFSYQTYQHPVRFPSFEETRFERKYSAIILFTGIANPYPLKDYLRYRCRELITIDFPDHHSYTEQDILQIKKTWDEYFSHKKIIVTTEKDAMRLINSPYLRLLKDLPVVYVPIKVKFHGEDAQKFNHQILSYVRENQRNRPVHSNKNIR
ncbi:tetraacyldisaccharide 4'-kinase [Candidatus Sulfidibacterium hydrothermale]|uniref:tetraacyldisaccharide 4'-kinase n=1 Tax=Candidatus Sulfidibacterium hydrothermale TaxID=2875962 RepID=UPI001F0B59B9|nr:tetraacyldisaccharide 4'-kinase [Candidatus Sulfidibacterium hydrothermale]UBM61430.1 tetraacyldisaccharide 4'-kinase [Candidatus Sulfidibacterium hydrothermale]